MKRLATALVLLPVAGTAHAACPSITVDDMQGVEPGQYETQFDLAAFEKAASCELSFTDNPKIESLNAEIRGNDDQLPPVAERLPDEPLVHVPYDKIGSYGGTLDGISVATEAGTSDILSVRHVNLVRYNDELDKVVPHVAKSYSWNDDYTKLTFKLREGHKWSDGAPFTAEDITFWYNHMVMNENIIQDPPRRFLTDGKPMEVSAPDPQTVVFELAQPKPGLLPQFATDYAQPFQPKHFLGQFHPALNDNANDLAAEYGFEDGYELINFYYGQSDWKDVPSPLLKNPKRAQELPKDVVPTLESHILVEDSRDGRHLVANPYYFAVDTAGNQLPYINEIDEVYITDAEVRTLRMVNGEIDYKMQSVHLPKAPTLLQNAEKGNYRVQLRPTTEMPALAFNLTAENEAKREAFQDVRFRRAMSHAINREEIVEVAYYGKAEPVQYTAFDPDTTSFVSQDQKTAYIAHDPAKARNLLKQAGIVDDDGDGVRELANGERFTLQIRFSSQGVSAELVELVADDWSNVGVKTTVKEVTTDEYRSAQSANELDVHVWKKGEPLSVLLSNSQTLVPPYGSFFGLRNGMLWARYMQTDGEEGLEPPRSVDEMQKMINEFQTLAPGSERSNELGHKIVDKVVEDLYFIGVAKTQNPIYAHNTLENFKWPKLWGYPYYWSFAYRPTQWSLAE